MSAPDALPDEAVERLARAFYADKAIPGLGWEQLDSDLQNGWLRYAGRQLKVLAPVVAALVRKGAADELLWAATLVECHTDLVMLMQRAAALRAQQ